MLQASTRTISIARRFCGPPESGNGGYVCGRLASFIDGAAVVRLHVPPPLDEPLEVRPAGGGVEMIRGATLVASARGARVELDVPRPPSFEEAAAAARAYAGFRSHPFPTCFVCGPRRAEGDGLRIFPGRNGGSALVASPWCPHASLGEPGGRVCPEYLWAALDCPGAFSFLEEGKGALLGELAVELRGGVTVGERCVVVGWETGRDGRRHYTGTALYSGDGQCRGVAQATWFELPAN